MTGVATPSMMALANRTTSGNSPAERVPTMEPMPYVGAPVQLQVALTLAALAGGSSPTLAAEIQWSNDGTNWFSASPADTLPTLSAVGAVASKEATVKAPYWRVNYTVTGTPTTCQFQVDAHYSA